MEQIKIMIVGDNGVGKTTLASRFTNDNFNFETFNPREMNQNPVSKQIDIDGTPVNIEIHHLLRPEDWNIRDLTIKQCEGFVVMYSIIAGATTFNDVVPDQIEYILQVKDCKADEISLMVVGNKHDLSNNRNVSIEQGQQIVKRFHQSYGFYEISAKTNYNVNELFIDLARRVIEKKKKFNNMKAQNSTEESKKSHCQTR